MQFYFSDRINQTSLKSFAPAGWMDRIERPSAEGLSPQAEKKSRQSCQKNKIESIPM